MRVRDAEPARPAYLVISQNRLDLPCGSCTLIPDPFQGFIFSAGSTDYNGDAAVTVGIPFSTTLIGARFLFQWFIDTTSGSCLGYDLSNAMEVQIDS